MDSIVVQEESVDMGDNEEENQTVEEAMKVHQFFLENPWTTGAKIMAEKDYLGVKAARDSQNERKRIASKFIVSKVREMEAESGSVIGSEKSNPLPSPWTELQHSLRPQYYQYNK